MLRLFICLLFVLLYWGNLFKAFATTYYISNSGKDTNSGTSLHSPLKTLSYLNTIKIKPGDKILFRRGDVFRGQLRPKNGTSDGYILYGAYGNGPKPILMGSVNKKEPYNWLKVAPNIWQTKIDTKDVGNIIFNDGELCGFKKWFIKSLKHQGDFFYDPEKKLLILFSTKNPGNYYKNIECALKRHIINQANRRYVIYDNLELKYGAAHGIGGGNTHHIIIRNCNISFIGGGHQYTKKDGTPVRYGNGIEFWGKAHDNLVENCRIWEVYDAALTNQNSSPKKLQYNIRYKNNTIWNCEYSFEYWNRPKNSLTFNIYFEDNTCLFAGYGWGHKQRPDPSGRHLCFYRNTAYIQNFNITNNIFYEAKDTLFYINWSDSNLSNLKLQRNCWYQSSGSLIYFRRHKKYKINSFEKLNFYPLIFLKDNHAKIAKPIFQDIKNCNFQQSPNSPCVNMGAKSK